MQVGGAHATAAAVTLGEHLQQGVKSGAWQADIGRGAGQQLIEVILAPLAAGHLGDYLLGQHVQRRLGNDQGIQLAAAHAVEQRGALDQLVARLRKQAALGRAADAVAGAADPLQQGGNTARRTDLADQLDLADVDAQLQRGGGHQHPQFAALEALLGVQAQLLGQAAVVGGDRMIAQALGQVAAGALGQTPGVDEQQGGAVLSGQFGQAIVDLVPHLVAHHRFQLHGRHLDGQVASAAVADVDDHAVTGRPWWLGCGLGQQRQLRLYDLGVVRRQRRLTAEQEAGHRLQRLLRGGQADAQQRPAAQGLQPFEAEHQVAAAFAPGDGMDLVDDQAATAGQHRPAGV
jgi:hypothetical protein